MAQKKREKEREGFRSRVQSSEASREQLFLLFGRKERRLNCDMANTLACVRSPPCLTPQLHQLFYLLHLMPVIRLRLYLFITIVFLFLYLVFQRSQSSRFDLYPPLATNSSLGWGVATRVSVISLPKRSDRRASLSPLWKAHRHYNIQYINATSVEAPEVDHIMEHVRRERRMERAGLDDQGLPSPRRPSFNDGLGKDPNQLWGSDLWTTDPPLPDEDVLDPDRLFPIPAEQGNPFNPHRLPTPSNVRKSYVLSRAMVACWHSHLQAIHQIAISRPSPLETYIILEDDVDFEWEIKTILTSLWKSLPNDWEMVMLGTSNLP